MTLHPASVLIGNLARLVWLMLPTLSQEGVGSYDISMPTKLNAQRSLCGIRRSYGINRPLPHTYWNDSTFQYWGFAPHATTYKWHKPRTF